MPPLLPLADVIGVGAWLLLFSRPGALAYAALALPLLLVSSAGPAWTRPVRSREVLGVLAAASVPALLAPFLLLEREVAPLLRAVPAMILLVLGLRMLAGRLVRAIRARGRFRERAVIVGTGAVAHEAAAALLRHRSYGVDPIGFVDDVAPNGSSLPILGPLAELGSIVRTVKANRVIVAYSAAGDPQLVSAIRACAPLPTEIHVVSRLFELWPIPDGPNVDDVGTLRFVRLRRAALRSAGWRLKRAIDVVVSAIGLVLLSPLFVVGAIAVRLSGPGPILFRQARLTEGGREFRVMKFRTLPERPDSDTRWSIDGIQPTRIGRLLRRTCLDELPQLLNVLRGDMSLVGPRPERPFFVSRFQREVHAYDARHRVPAGITGWAQVNGLRGDSSIVARAAHDNRYIDDWSLWFDLVILGKTVRAVLRGEGS